MNPSSKFYEKLFKTLTIIFLFKCQDKIQRDCLLQCFKLDFVITVVRKVSFKESQLPSSTPLDIS